MKKRQRGGGGAGKTQAERANGEQMPEIRSGIVSAQSDGGVRGEGGGAGEDSAAGSLRKEPPIKRGRGEEGVGVHITFT